MRNYEGTTRLQGVGVVEGIRAINVRVGDRRVWNGGSSSEVIRVEVSKTGKTVKITTLYFKELSYYDEEQKKWIGEWKEDTRVLRADSIVVITELNPEAKEEVVVDEVEELIKESKEMISNIEELTTTKAIVECGKMLDKIYPVVNNLEDEKRRYRLRDMENHIKWIYSSLCEAIEEEQKLKQSAFEKWLRTFIEEKGLDLHESFDITHNGQFHIMELGALIDIIVKSSKAEQKQIKNTIVMIDFKNGDVMHYFNFLAEAYIKTNY